MRFSTILVLFFILLFASCKPKPVTKDNKISAVEVMTKLLQGRWLCNKMWRDGKEVNVKKVVGEVFMKFDADNFSLTMAGDGRTFKYAVKQDSVVNFTDVKDYPALKIVSLDKEKFVCDQYYPSQNFTITWEMLTYKTE